MYSFKFGDFTVTIKKHSNGAVIILSGPNIESKVKLGIVTSGEIYSLEDFQWVKLDDNLGDKLDDGSDDKLDNPKGSDSLIGYIFDKYLSTVDSDSEIKTALINLTGEILSGRNHTIFGPLSEYIVPETK